MNIIELKNGLKIILEKRKGTGLVSIDTSINCGYAYESKPGTSIITSKTLIKGTKSLSLDKILQKTEGEGGEIISSTDTDYSDITMFTHSANTYEQIKILASILTEPLFDKKEIEKQKKLVLNNIKSIKDNPSSYVSVKLLEEAFQNQPYANTPLTQEAEIEKITQEDVKELFSKHYNASNMVVSIVGDINLEKVKETCEEHLSKIPAGDKQDLPKSEYTPFYLIKEDKNIDQANLKLCFKGVGRDHPDYLTYKLLIATISGGFSSRMFKAMRIEDQLVYSFNLTNLGFKSDGVFCINAGTGKGKAEILIPKAMQELANFISTIEDEEVESAITAYEKSFQNNLYDLNACSSFYSYELLKYGFVHNSKNLQNKLKKISKNDLLRISLDILKSEPSLISVGPKDGIHSKEEIVSIKNKIVNEINFEEALKRAGSTETNPQWLPLKETEEDYGEFKISKLKNGLRIISQNRPNNLVTCGYWVGAGGQNETPEEHGISHMLEHMVFKGTKNFGPEEIDGIIEKKLSCYLNAFTTKDKTCYYSYNISPDNIYKIANLLGEMVFTPTLSDVEFNGGTKEDGSIMKDGEKEVVFEEINRSNDNVSNLVYYGTMKGAFGNTAIGGRVLGTKESLAPMTGDSLKQYHDKWYVPNNITFVAIGDVNHDELVSKLNEMWGNIEPVEIKEIKDWNYIGEETKLIKKDKEMSMLNISYEAKPERHELSLSYEILAIILGQGKFSKLHKKIVEKDKLASHISSGTYAMKNAGLLMISTSCKPENVDKIKETVFDIIKNIEISEEELKMAILKFKTDKKSEMLSPSDTFVDIGYSYMNTGDINSIEKVEKDLNKVTMETIREVINSIIKSKPTISIVGK